MKSEATEMNAEYDDVIQKQQIQEIKQAGERCDEVYWWKKRLVITGWCVYAAAGFIWIVQDNDRGLPLMLLAFMILLFSEIVLGYMLHKRRRSMLKLVFAFRRQNALPLYQDMLEKFADQPHLHIHLNDDGTIIITDRKKKEIK